MFNFLRSAPTPSLAEVIQMAARGEVVLLDVREAAELQASGTAKGALHIPLSIVPIKAAETLAKDKPVAVFCAAGARAGQAAQALGGMGYTAWNIGGFGQWAAAGGPTVRV
ncbi:rhodanese-like domain-containing protein [Stagnihabitans tardus]|uniref:Sulfurtransferase n=1 Tax=Stagnihabitans tardus TaxID=2699202 RepID=A0AAE4YC70_9RHOB|nr:rhodanese-like domain-containing protein [Stagnihabitans tardus]NBZ89971.1 sulfurtransferase [Stagnihabitans tardus]